MAAATYGHDLTTFNDATNAANWAEATGMLVAGGPDVDTDLAILGTISISQDRAGVGLSSQVATETGPTLPTDGVFLIWTKFFAPNSLTTLATGGQRVLVGSDTSNYYGWYMDGSDTYPYGGWVNYAVDPTNPNTGQTQGSPTGTYNTVGNGWNCDNEVKKGNPYNTDIIRYGRGISYFGNGDLGNGYATFAGFAAINDNATTGRLGLIQSVGGGYLYKGLMSLGSGTTAVDFRDENTAITIDNTRKVSFGFNKIEIHNVSSNVEMSRVSFTSLSLVSPGSFQVVDNATVNLDSCSFTDMDEFLFLSQTSATTITFSRCGPVTQSGSTIEGCIFSESSGATAVSLYVDDLDKISACDFISNGLNHAMELNSNHAGNSYTLIDFTYVGYASPSTPAFTGTTGNEVIYNNSGGHVQLTVNGGDTPSVRNGASSTTELVTSVILSFTVIDSGGNPISGVTAYIDDDDDSPYIMNKITDSNGEASTTWTGGLISDATWRVRLYGYKPYIAITDVPATGTKELPVTLIRDLQQT